MSRLAHDKTQREEDNEMQGRNPRAKNIVGHAQNRKISAEGMQPDLNRWRVLYRRIKQTDGSTDTTLGAPAGLVALALVAVLGGDVFHTVASQALMQVIEL